MTKDEMREGFLQGRTLIQEEWAPHDEIQAVDELIKEGVAEVEDDWRYIDTYQCERRRVKGKGKTSD